jgi:hypothetical protein
MSLRDRVLLLQQLLKEHVDEERAQVETLTTWLQELKEAEAFAPFEDTLEGWETVIDSSITDFLNEEPQA